MRILINVPDLRRPGGVAVLFNILRMEIFFNNISIFILHNRFPALFRIPYKYIAFILKLQKTDLVHINPSLNRKCFFRDALFARLTLLFSKKLIVYWHGWDITYEQKIRNNKFLFIIAKHSFLKAHASIVLGTLFENKLRTLGYMNHIFIETNTADSKYIKEIESKVIAPDETVNLLFLSRTEKEKGIYLAIDTLKILNKYEKRYKLIIAGTGKEEERIKRIARDNDDIEWAGYVTSESKHILLSSARFMFFPSFYPEGMPLTILEGMMYGLPIISRPVGGIPDMIKSEENGYLIDSTDPEAFAKKISLILNNPDHYFQISHNNIEKSKQFSPEIVRERLMKIYEFVSNN